MYKDFHDLEIWKDGYTLLMKIYDASVMFPPFEQFSLKSQIIRSSNSVIANIAESNGRYYYADKIRVLYIARGEIVETRSHLAVAYGQKYIVKDKFKELNEGYKKLAKDLNLFINSLINSKIKLG